MILPIRRNAAQRWPAMAGCPLSILDERVVLHAVMDLQTILVFEHHSLDRGDDIHGEASPAVDA